VTADGPGQRENAAGEEDAGAYSQAVIQAEGSGGHGIGDAGAKVGELCRGELRDWGFLRRGEMPARLFNIGRGHFIACDTCRTYIFVGSNLMSSWREEAEDIWRANSASVEGYEWLE